MLFLLNLIKFKSCTCDSIVCPAFFKINLDSHSHGLFKNMHNNDRQDRKIYCANNKFLMYTISLILYIHRSKTLILQLIMLLCQIVKQNTVH